ncbi:hypothetical protein [Rhizobium ruizarguesonis]|uniref:hypothetical protein n=1 Tax=Rhizobium ruizarguesonis TaxID=2081791 RepID=UPI001031013D|nr:hypothetical protein [Rhizobium ruizarguesonis]TBA18772.1 hypothetical protein ELH65_23945 [Rhizobium ruizarguesonis]
MRKIIGAMCLVLALAPGVRANDDYGTVGFQLKAYPADDSVRMSMISMFRTLHAANYFLENRGAVPIACQPFGTGTNESYTALMAYLQQHPELGKRPVSDLWDIYVEAMARSFPCKN